MYKSEVLEFWKEESEQDMRVQSSSLSGVVGFWLLDILD